MQCKNLQITVQQAMWGRCLYSLKKTFLHLPEDQLWGATFQGVKAVCVGELPNVGRLCRPTTGFFFSLVWNHFSPSLTFSLKCYSKIRIAFGGAASSKSLLSCQGSKVWACQQAQHLMTQNSARDDGNLVDNGNQTEKQYLILSIAFQSLQRRTEMF